MVEAVTVARQAKLDALQRQANIL
eukprot:SAG31_NODE_26006_length_450_cov_0.888889_1_plen_23_part_10